MAIGAFGQDVLAWVVDDAGDDLGGGNVDLRHVDVRKMKTGFGQFHMFSFSNPAVGNKDMGKVILVGSANDPVPFFLAPGSLTTGASAQSFIRLEPGTGQYEYFRMIRVCSDNVSILHSRFGRLEVVTLDSPDNIGSVQISSEQYFQLDYEPMDVDSIEYKFKESRRFNERPHILVDTSNETGSEQTLTYELNEKTSTTSKWDYKVGIKLDTSHSLAMQQPLGPIRYTGSQVALLTHGHCVWDAICHSWIV
ncbi:hypothetical protein D9611_006069 [Ephemerocybe angulata]|uniref:Uncharacterized protein n=1 Tax=Ephemerocybe angulata TaxID=980116 RepID=A0A8H5CH39_9AGAR|nr:hypothetical protein D9611_006069 [Tulosesus angulatus]